MGPAPMTSTWVPIDDDHQGDGNPDKHRGNVNNDDHRCKDNDDQPGNDVDDDNHNGKKCYFVFTYIYE